MSELVCYCFSYSVDDIRRDAVRHGRSLIVERITAEKRAGGCHCAETNPSGR